MSQTEGMSALAMDWFGAALEKYRCSFSGSLDGVQNGFAPAFEKALGAFRTGGSAAVAIALSDFSGDPKIKDSIVGSVPEALPGT
jgi:hypothetical protein